MIQEWWPDSQEGHRYVDDAIDQSDVVRFHQSLTFTDGCSNRSEDEIRAIREVCRGLINPAFGAGLDDPGCRAR
jgi:hypothetical protein